MPGRFGSSTSEGYFGAVLALVIGHTVARWAWWLKLVFDTTTAGRRNACSWPIGSPKSTSTISHCSGSIRRRIYASCEIDSRSATDAISANCCCSASHSASAAAPFQGSTANAPDAAPTVKVGFSAAPNWTYIVPFKRGLCLLRGRSGRLHVSNNVPSCQYRRQLDPDFTVRFHRRRAPPPLRDRVRRRERTPRRRRRRRRPQGAPPRPRSAPCGPSHGVRSRRTRSSMPAVQPPRSRTRP